MLRTLTNEPTRASAPQRNPPCGRWSCWSGGAMRVCIKCSSTLTQHDTTDTWRTLPGIAGSPCLKMGTTTMCFHRDGTVPHVKTRLNNFTKGILPPWQEHFKKRRTSSPTADSTHRDNTRRSSELVKGSSNGPASGREMERPANLLIDVCMERLLKRAPGSSSNGHEVLPPLL